MYVSILLPTSYFSIRRLSDHIIPVIITVLRVSLISIIMNIIMVLGVYPISIIMNILLMIEELTLSVKSRIAFTTEGSHILHMSSVHVVFSMSF